MLLITVSTSSALSALKVFVTRVRIATELGKHNADSGLRHRRTPGEHRYELISEVG
jgi:hypothetical protein